MEGTARFRNVHAGDTLLAQIFDFSSPGPVIFPTPPEAEMQCGFGALTEATEIAPHLHNRIRRSTQHSSEFFYVIEGLMQIEFLDPRGQSVGKAEIGPQMGVLQFIGGHRISFAAGTRFFEIKQGPYMGKDSDKTLL